MVLETQRLALREMTQADFSDLCKILQDDDVMYAYEAPIACKEYAFDIPHFLFYVKKIL